MFIIYGYLCRHNDDVYNVFESNIIVSKLWLKKKTISTSDHCQIEYFYRLCILFSKPFYCVIHSLTEPNKKKELVEIAFMLLFVFLFSSLAFSIINSVFATYFFQLHQPSTNITPFSLNIWLCCDTLNVCIILYK